MQIVNGYFCRDCADVARAKQGIDPARDERTAKERAASAHGPAERPQLAQSGDVGTRLHVIA
jgi:hypothetical protein